mgnify:CR=1 FL=1
MYSYIIGFIFLIVSLWFLSELGNGCFDFTNRNYSLNLIVGYVLYSFLQAIGGIVVQIFQLPYMFFFIYMILLVIGLFIFVYKKKKNINFSKQLLIEHLKKYAFLYIIVVFLMLFSMLNVEYNWLANCLDDGRYLNLAATFPFENHPYLISPATGLEGTFDLARSINTFEIEYSFWIHLLNIEPTIFTRMIMNIFNYTLMLHAIYAFGKEVLATSKFKIDEKYIQFCLTPILLFAFYDRWLAQYHLLQMQDAWQFSTAMWYGSSIVRIIGVFLCLVPVLSIKRINKTNFVYCFMVSVVLMSKASQALPIIFILLIGYLITWGIINKIKFNKYIIIGLAFLLCIIPILTSSGTNIIDRVNYILSINYKSIIWMGSILIIFFSFSLKNSIINRWNTILIIFGIMVWVPRMNHLFVNLSMYDFVAARATTTLIFTTVMTASVYAFVFVMHFIKSWKATIILFCSIFLCLSGCLLYSYNRDYGLKRGIVTILRNPYLLPKGTYDLSMKLNELSHQYSEKLNVLSQNAVGSNGYISAVSVLLRVKAPYINSISAIPRYNEICDESAFKTFDQEEQWIFESFNTKPYEDGNIDAFKKLLAKYPINCIVAITEEAKNELLNLGFILFDQIDVPTDAFSYFIMYK